MEGEVMGLIMRESFVNLTKGHRFGESDWYEPWTSDIGRLYKELTKEYGRCQSKVYLDMGAAPAPYDLALPNRTVQTGWVFIKRCEYDDAHRIARREDRSYMREVWVSLAWRNENNEVQTVDLTELKALIKSEQV
jgi:hypothetical protein